MKRVALVAVLVLALAWVAAPYVSAVALLADLSGTHPGWRQWLPVRVHQVSWRDVDVPTRTGPVPARLYEPEGTSRGLWIVVPGLHAGGVDEPRLVRLTTRLAAEGLTVLSLPLPDLRAFHIVTRSTDQIEDAVLWATGNDGVGRAAPVTLAGISFGGGLALAAAGRPAITNRLHRAVSFGGHGLLPRAIDYVCTGLLPDGTPQPPHDYGIAILLLQGIPYLVPPDQAQPLDEAVRAYLDASMANGIDQPRADVLFARAATLSAQLAEPARAIMQEVNARDVRALGARLLPLAEVVGGAPALSPERSPVPTAPVFLIHGAHDTVIPQTESTLLADFYRSRGGSVEVLLTSAISHADPSAHTTFKDVWDLIRMWVRISA